MIVLTRASSQRLTPEDFEIQQRRVPRRARFVYMLGDTTDAEIMFAWVDAAADSRARIEAAALADAHRMYEREHGKPFGSEQL
jgi:hypothetical protein